MGHSILLLHVVLSGSILVLLCPVDIYKQHFKVVSWRRFSSNRFELETSGHLILV